LNIERRRGKTEANEGNEEKFIVGKDFRIEKLRGMMGMCDEEGLSLLLQVVFWSGLVWSCFGRENGSRNFRGRN